jgi:uncharacterized protein YbjT (DUF2867 family)
MRGKLVTIFGGTGFLGRYVVPKLIEEGALIRIAVRDIDLALPLKVAGYVGQVEVYSVNPADEKSVSKVIGDSDCVINLIGILFESGKNNFERVHADIPTIIAKAASKQGVKRLVHVSAIGADLHAKSRYSVTKGRGEIEVLKAFPNATIIRPSVMFGEEDKFFNKFASMARISPFLPVIGDGTMRLQPVYVDDVAEVIRKVLTDQRMDKNPHAGKTYELGGPGIYTFKELMTFVLGKIHKKRILLPIPYSLGLLMGSVMQVLPSPQLTRDQVKLIKSDNVVSKDALTFKNMGIEPASLESIVPGYLRRYQYHG